MVKWIVKLCLLPYSTGWERKADAEKYCPVRHVVLRHHLAESKFSSEETFPNMAAHGRCWWVQFSFWYQALNANLQAVMFVRRCKQPARCNKFRLLIFLNQLYMFRATNSPILRSTFWLYIQLLVQSTDIAADRWQCCHRSQQYQCIVQKAVQGYSKWLSGF